MLTPSTHIPSHWLRRVCSPLLALVLLLPLSSCQLASDQEIPAPFYAPPTLTFGGSGSTSGIHRAGKRVPLTVVASANGFLKELRMFINGQLTQTTVFETNDGIAKTITMAPVIAVTAPLGSVLVYRFELEDRQGQVAAAQYSATVDPNFIPRTLVLTDTMVNGTAFRRVSGRLNIDQTLPAGPNYLITDTVRVLDEGVLTIDPGATFYGRAGALLTDRTGFLDVLATARLVANGTQTSPIVFTSIRTLPGQGGPAAAGDWGGILIAGLGGTDTSGSLRYVRVEYGGAFEAKGLRLNNVGTGTLVEYIQIFKNLDDGFRIAGGTVRVRRIIVTDCHTAGFRWGDGWTGFAQFVVAHCSFVKPENSGLTRELRGAGATTFARMANLTLIGPTEVSGGTARGWRLEDASSAIVYNMLVNSFPNNAIRMNGVAPGGQVSFFNTHAWRCPQAWHSSTDPRKTLNGNSENQTATLDMSGVSISSFVGTHVGTGANPADMDPWFEPAQYAGAVLAANDWTAAGNWARNADGTIR